MIKREGTIHFPKGGQLNESIFLGRQILLLCKYAIKEKKKYQVINTVLFYYYNWNDVKPANNNKHISHFKVNKTVLFS